MLIRKGFVAAMGFCAVVAGALAVGCAAEGLTGEANKRVPEGRVKFIDPNANWADAVGAKHEIGKPWLDDRGLEIQAHGGGILKLGDTYYWFGEDRSRNNGAKKCVACYASKDLMNWKFKRQVVAWAEVDNIGRRWVLERPKVFYNEKTKKFVMYMHIDGMTNPKDTNPRASAYELAQVGIATSDTVDGDYKFVKRFRPLGHESRDIGQFVDDDGSAYLIFEDRGMTIDGKRVAGFHIAQLADDFMSVAKETCFVKESLEGGALVHYKGLYYAIGSHLTGWDANANLYATAKSLEGPWSEFKDIAPPKTRTWGSQSTLMLKVVGTKSTTVVFMGDVWKKANLWDSRYLWVPVEIGDGKLSLPEPKPWMIDVTTGEWALKK